jgi:hypothetical protein
MKATQLLVLVTLVSTLWLGSAINTNAQSAWPDAKKAPVAQTSPAKSRKAASKARRSGATRTPPVLTVEQATLRTMSEIIARQTLAIEALALRLEAAERRLDLATVSVPESPVDESADPFRTARVVDWAQVVDGLGR